jgi:hypothetical protein
MTTTDGRYSEYEACLVALCAIPGELARALASADRAYGDSRAEADQAYQREAARLDRLEHSSRTRYKASADALSEHGVALPHKLHPAQGVAGDDSGLRSALAAESAATAAVDSALRDASSSARRREEDTARRAAASREAADALRARQARVLSERQAAQEATRHREAADAAARSARLRRGWIAAGALLALAAAAALIIIVINH